MSFPSKSSTIFCSVTATGVPNIFGGAAGAFSFQNADFTHYNLYLDGLGGVFNGTVAIQVLGLNGVWQTPTSQPWTQPAAFTGTQVIFMDLPYQFLGIRLNCTAFTSGSLAATLIAS